MLINLTEIELTVLEVSLDNLLDDIENYINNYKFDKDVVTLGDNASRLLQKVKKSINEIEKTERKNLWTFLN